MSPEKKLREDQAEALFELKLMFQELVVDAISLEQNKIKNELIEKVSKLGEEVNKIQKSQDDIRQKLVFFIRLLWGISILCTIILLMLSFKLFFII